MATEHVGITTSVIGLVDYTSKHIDEFARNIRNLDNPEKIRNTSRDCEYVRKELHKLDEDLREKQVKVKEDLQADFHAQIANIEEAFQKASRDFRVLDRLLPREEQSVAARLGRIMTKMRRLCCVNTYAVNIEDLAGAISDARAAVSKLTTFVCLPDQIQFLQDVVQKGVDQAKDETNVQSNPADDERNIDIGGTSPDSKNSAMLSPSKAKDMSVDDAAIRDHMEPGSITNPPSDVGHAAADVAAIHVNPPADNVKTPHPNVEDMPVDVTAIRDDMEPVGDTKPHSSDGHTAVEVAARHIDSQAEEVKAPPPKVEDVSVEAAPIRVDLEAGSAPIPSSKADLAAVDTAAVQEGSQASTGSLSDSFKRKVKLKLKKKAKEGTDPASSRSKVRRQKINVDRKFLATIRASLQAADQWAEKRELRLQNGQNLQCSQLFTALAVLRPEIQVSGAMLMKLWRLPDETLVREIVGKLAELNLITMDTSKAKEYYVGLHGPALEYCQLQAQDHLRQYHIDLLDEYFRSGSDVMTLEPVTHAPYIHLQSSHEEASLRTWWTATNDGYIHENVCRHLAAGGGISELVALLAHGRWTQFRNTCGGLPSWKNDFQCAIDAIGNMNGPGAVEDSTKNVLQGLRLVRDAVQESWVFITKNPREFAFQIHARLCDVPSENWPISVYLESTMNITEKPCLKPMRRYWNRPGRALSTEIFREGSVSSIALTNDMVLAVLAVEREVLVCRMDTRTILERLRGHKSEVKSVAMSQDGARVASVSSDGTALFWNRKSKASCSEPTHLLSEGLFTCVAMTRDGSLVLAGSRDGSVKLWDWRKGKLVQELQQHDGPVTAIAISEDGKCIASSSEDGSLRLWDGVSGDQRFALLHGNGSLVSCIAVSADGSHVVSGSHDNTIKLWNGESGKLLHEPLRGHAAWVRCVAMTADGTRIVSGADDNTLRVWDGRSGEALTTFCRHKGGVSAVAISRDGMNIVTGSRDESIRLWNLQKETGLNDRRQRHRDSVMCVAVSADGTRIASGSKDETVLLWNGKNGLPVCGPLRRHEARVTCLALSANGSWVVSGSDDTTIRMWKWEDQQEIGETLRGHEGSVSCVAVSDDGRSIVSGSQDRTLRLWDLGAISVGSELLHGHTDRVNCVAISSNGSTVVSGSRDRTIRLWKVSSRTMIGSPVKFNACSVWIRDGFAFARHRYFGGGKVGTKCWLIDEEKGLIRCDTGFSSNAATNDCEKKGKPNGVSWRIPRIENYHVGAESSYGDGLLSTLPSTLGANLVKQYSLVSCYKQRVISGQTISDEGHVIATLPAGLGISIVEQDAWFFQPTGRTSGVLVVGLRDGMVCILELIRETNGRG